MLLFGILLFLFPFGISCSSNSSKKTQTSDNGLTSENEKTKVIYATIGETKMKIDLEDNSSSEALVEILKKKDITYIAHNYGDFEKVGSIGYTLPQNDKSITTNPGDVILYQGTSICFYYDTNTWSFTKIGKINEYSKEELRSILKANEGNITIMLSIS